LLPLTIARDYHDYLKQFTRACSLFAFIFYYLLPLYQTMKKIIFAGLVILLLSAFKGKAHTATLHLKSTSFGLAGDSIIQRIVCFKFKAGTTQEAIEQHMRGFRHLKDSIPYILSYRAGSTVKGDLTEKPEYDVMHYCTYRNEEEIRLYSVHPVHQRFIQQNKANWEKVLVINSVVAP
jgi:hypothetical protein